jgi:membrane fusion protein (multidrug efflux system)
MKWKIILAVLAVLLVVGVLGGVKALQFSKLIAAGKAYVPPPESVSSAVVREENWQDTIEAIGSVAAVQGVTITPELAGTVSEIAFESGAVVAKGDLLLRLDTTTEKAQARALEAQVHLTEINVERMRQLRASNTVSQAELDTAEAAWNQNKASAEAINAAVEKKTIRAPFAGRLGIRLVNLGEYLDTGKPIVSLQSLSPVYADFSLPQQDLARIKRDMPVHLWTDTYTNRQFEGKLTAMNPDLDSATRSVRLQATLDNADLALRPGMFARVDLLLPTEQKLLVIPATAVLSAPYGDSVFVIEPSSATNSSTPGLVVRQQFVRVGRTRGDFVSIVTGVKAGERVVSSGLFKLRNGIAVVENNDIAPKISETPRPPDR